jgi:uncharacterized repeat protein (TIGR01451 family)
VVVAGCSGGHGKGSAPSTALMNPSSTIVASSPASATATLAGRSATAASFPLRRVDWSQVVAAQLGCGQFPAAVFQLDYVHPAEGTSEALVLAHCQTGASFWPLGFYAYDSASSPDAAHLAQILIDPNRDTQGDSFAVTRLGITMTLSSFSSLRVPSCCPDLHFSVHWTWMGGSYAGTPAGIVGPVPIALRAIPSSSKTSVGQSVTFTVMVVNTGSVPLANTVVNGVTLQPGTGIDEPTCGTAPECTIGTLEPAASMTVTIRAKVTRHINPYLFRINVNGVFPTAPSTSESNRKSP